MAREWTTLHTYDEIKYEFYNGIAKITINRPEVRNAFRPKTVMEMIDALGSGDEERAVETTVKHLRHIERSLDEGKPNRLRGGLFDAFDLSY